MRGKYVRGWIRNCADCCGKVFKWNVASVVVLFRTKPRSVERYWVGKNNFPSRCSTKTSKYLKYDFFRFGSKLTGWKILRSFTIFRGNFAIFTKIKRKASYWYENSQFLSEIDRGTRWAVGRYWVAKYTSLFDTFFRNFQKKKSSK